MTHAKALVGIIMGSRSDWETMVPARNTLEELHIAFEMQVLSAHRMPDEMYRYAEEAGKRGLTAIIAAAGGAAHLPGMTAAKTLVPVIGVPVQSKTLNGLDSLLSIVQMPPGIPVATMAINGAVNAALFAARIIALHDEGVASRLADYIDRMHDTAMESHARLMDSIGVIGGGQLGRMFALDAKRMGYNVVVLDPQEHSPCGQVADEQIVQSYDNRAALEELGRKTDIVTYEFENIAIASVEYIEELKYLISPASNVLKITQNRLFEKRFVRECGIPTADFEEINRVDDISNAAMTVGFPAVLKTVRGGYDGKGQWRAQSLDEARAAFSASKGAQLIFERFVPFTKELSVIATRNAADDVVTFPVAENVHAKGILAMTIAPARVSDDATGRARGMACTIGRKLGIVGTYCVEFFLTAADELLVNEIAPRPHNSGHYTIDVMPCSQYEQHIRAICGLPLSPPCQLSNAIMMNILGDGNGDRLDRTAELLADPSIVLHMYGKQHAVAQRKMGHFTMLVDGLIDETAIGRARKAHANLRWIKKT